MTPGLFGATLIGPFTVPGRDSISVSPLEGPYPYAVGADFFRTMELEIVRGRGIEPTDDTPGAPPVMVVSESLANRFWPDEDPIGQCAEVRSGDDRVCATIVGVVEDAHRISLIEEESQLVYYTPLRRQIMRSNPSLMVVRVGSDDGLGIGADRSLLGTIRSTAQAVSPRIRFARVERFADRVEPQLRTWRLGATAFSAFGLLALIVAAVGLYSVLSFDVAGRAREMGIRSALGARSGTLARMIAVQMAALVGAGIVIGVSAVGVGGRWIEPLLYEVAPTDPWLLAMVASILAVVAAVATAIPALRAMRVDPVEVLQAE